MSDQAELAWNMYVQLREEVVSSQKIRAQIIGFKITFVTAAVGVILANQTAIGLELLVVPAFAAVLFDSLIGSYSVSIKRIGHYARTYLEPKLRESTSWPKADPLWEEYMHQPVNRQGLSMVGNFGFTTMILLLATWALITGTRTFAIWMVLLALAFVTAIDLFFHLRARHLLKKHWSQGARFDKTQGPNTAGVIMNKKFFISWAVVYVVWMAGSFVVHGVLLGDGYAALPNLFRPPEEANKYFHLMLIAHIVMAGAFVWIYQRGNEHKPWLAQGVKFGAAVALLAPIPTYTIYYVVQPMPGMHVVQQIVFETILLLIVGAVVAFLNKSEA